jgi:uncharacterized protein YecE (DUF72 family)
MSVQRPDTDGAAPEVGRGSIRVGLSGWSYRHWRNRFYPAGLPVAEQLRFVAEHFDTVEVNRSFYSFVSPEVYRSWAGAVGDDFRFAVKGSRYITHQKKLNDVEVPLANFFASGVGELGEKLGPILWQLPASWRFDAVRVNHFLGLLPATFAEAAEVAHHHDHRVPEITMPIAGDQPIRHVLEVRHPSAVGDSSVEVARRASVAIACSDSASWGRTTELTADFAYVRLHGPGRLYDSSYSSDQLDFWADLMGGWSHDGIDVYAYFDNDGEARAPHDALALIERLAYLSAR